MFRDGFKSEVLVDIGRTESIWMISELLKMLFQARGSVNKISSRGSRVEREVWAKHSRGNKVGWNQNVKTFTARQRTFEHPRPPFLPLNSLRSTLAPSVSTIKICTQAGHDITVL
jgi:hypothetical protein